MKKILCILFLFTILFNSIAYASDDYYTESQCNWILVLALMGLFIFGGFGTGHPIGYIFSFIVAFAAIVLASIVWSW